MTYSIAIRTLALSQESLRKVLESIFRQTVLPEKVVIYIAQGYTAPLWRIASEEYVYVPKGMMRQRALKYDDLNSDYILMLDDDVELSSTAAEYLLKTAETERTDLLSADIFKNHKLPIKAKLFAALTSLVTPHFKQTIAFKLKQNGSFSYIAYPQARFYPSDTCPGPIMLWRKDSFVKVNAKDEIWIDSLGFAYGDDALLSYKAVANGMKVGIDFNVKVFNLDSRTSSNKYHKDKKRFYIRSKAIFINWWRMRYKPYGNHNSGELKALNSGIIKWIWLLFIMLTTSAATLSLTPITSFFRGMYDGYKYVHSPEYTSIPSYIINC